MIIMIMTNDYDEMMKIDFHDFLKLSAFVKIFSMIITVIDACNIWIYYC